MLIKIDKYLNVILVRYCFGVEENYYVFNRMLFIVHRL